MVEISGYSLWFIPPGNIYEQLVKLISRLNREYSAPKFEPHVTLLGDIFVSKEEMLSKTATLADVIKPLTIKLTRVEYLDEYFGCLFIRAEETDELIKTNLKAREIFNRQQDPKFMPHLSIMYGNFDSVTKEKIISEIDKEFNISFDVKNMHLVASSSKNQPEDWYRIKEFTLR